MAEDTQKPAAAEEVAVEKPVAEKEKEQAPAPVPEPEAPEKRTEESAAAAGVEEVVEAEKPKPVEEEKIAQSASFKEESNVVGELPDPQKKALDELKQLIQDALNKHEFTAPPPPPPPPPAAKEEEKAPEAPPKEKEAAAAAAEEQVVKAEEPKTGEEEKKPAVEVESKAPESEPAAPAEVEVVVEKVATVDEDGAKTVEAIEETIVAAKPEVEEAEVTTTKKEAEVAAPSDEQTKDKEAEVPPEKVFIWGIPLLGDDRSDTILLKFLRARDFKVKDAFTMIKNTVRWRNEFGIDAVLEEDLGNDLDKVVFMHGVDKEGHPVCYNVFGEFQNKELYHNNFSDDEKRTKFLKWRIQFLEKSIRKLDFSPSGICTIVQINDLKNSPGPAKRDLRIATNQAVHLLQDNYPEFVARQVFINVPWWYLAFNRMISPFLTQRTKSKFVFSGPSKSAETLFKYIAPEQVPVQYGGLSREGEQEFTTTDPVTEVVVKPASKYTVEIPVTERSILVWELRVLGWDVSYGAEFVPSAEGSYTVIVSKTRKVAPTDEPVICDTFKIGEPGKVVLTIDNQSSKKKKLLYRSKTKPSSD